MESSKSDYSKRLIALTVITLSAFTCTYMFHIDYKRQGCFKHKKFINFDSGRLIATTAVVEKFNTYDLIFVCK